MSRISSFFHATMSAHSPSENIRTRDTKLAACALLLELAHADDQFTQREFDHLQSAVTRQFGLDLREAEELLALAEKARAQANDLWQFTSLIKENYSRGQKMVLLEIMWGVVYADGELAAKEEYLMRKICNLLDLEPGYLAEVKKRLELRPRSAQMD
jgi:uncharacterized tellurite resistance protein B-like protein